MKILVYGAGVLGSLYATQLKRSGHEVTILARGQRLAEIQEHGLVLENWTSGEQTVTHIPVINQLDAQDDYELVIVLVRKNQLASVLPSLAANQRTPNVLFMVNNAAGPDEMSSALGPERVLLGFPGAGGERRGFSVRYHLTSKAVQRTTIGELNGSRTQRLERIAQTFREAGFGVAISKNMDAWLKTHVALVSPVANALYLAGGNNYRLAHTRDGVILMVRAIREGLRILSAKGIPITPFYAKTFLWVPEPVLVWFIQRLLDTQQVELVIARHANAARDEMRQLSAEFKALAQTTALPTVAIDRLNKSIDPNFPTTAEGTRDLPLDWSGVWVTLIALAIVNLTVWRLIVAKEETKD